MDYPYLDDATRIHAPGYWAHTIEDLALRLQLGLPADVARAYARQIARERKLTKSADEVLHLAFAIVPYRALVDGVELLVYGYDAGPSAPAFTYPQAKELWRLLTDDPWGRAQYTQVEADGVPRLVLSIPMVEFRRV
jgi:hypothetical protein